MTRKIPSIGFEGLDGVGKSTATYNVADILGGVVVTRIGLMPSWAKQRKVVNSGQDVDARFRYFRALNHEQLRLAKAIVNNGRAAVLDSTFYRTLATHRVLGSSMARAYEVSSSDVPDCTIVLDLPEAVRRQRLEARDGGLVFSSHWDETLYERSEDVIAEYESFNLPWQGSYPGERGLAYQALSLVRDQGFAV